MFNSLKRLLARTGVTVRGRERVQLPPNGFQNSLGELGQIVQEGIELLQQEPVDIDAALTEFSQRSRRRAIHATEQDLGAFLEQHVADFQAKVAQGGGRRRPEGTAQNP